MYVCMYVCMCVCTFLCLLATTPLNFWFLVVVDVCIAMSVCMLVCMSLLLAIHSLLTYSHEEGGWGGAKRIEYVDWISSHGDCGSKDPHNLCMSFQIHGVFLLVAVACGS